MRHQLLRTVGALVLGVGLLSGVAAAAPVIDASEAATASGPPGDLPGEVPDFVAAIIELIRELVAGVAGETPEPAVSDVASEVTG